MKRHHSSNKSGLDDIAFCDTRDKANQYQGRLYRSEKVGAIQKLFIINDSPGILGEVQHQFGSLTLFAVTWAYNKLFSHANNERNNSNGFRKVAKARPTATAQKSTAHAVPANQKDQGPQREG